MGKKASQWLGLLPVIGCAPPYVAVGFTCKWAVASRTVCAAALQTRGQNPCLIKLLDVAGGESFKMDGCRIIHYTRLQNTTLKPLHADI